jgi:hypothetical protein
METAEESGTAVDYMDRGEEWGDAHLDRDLAQLALEHHQRIHRSTSA